MPDLFLQLFAEAAPAEAEAAASAPETENTPAPDDAGTAQTEATDTAQPEKDTRPEEADAPKKPDPAMLLKSVEEALDARRRNDGLKKIIGAWEESAEELRRIYPGFDLKRELRENGEFARLMQAGVSVRRAYEAANLEKILGAALQYAARTAGKKTADSLRSQAVRVQENSVLDRASSLGHKDVNSLTKQDIMKILDEVSRGAKIKF